MAWEEQFFTPCLNGTWCLCSTAFEMFRSLQAVKELRAIRYCRLRLQPNKHHREWAAPSPQEGGERSHVGFLGWAEPQEKAAPVW